LLNNNQIIVGIEAKRAFLMIKRLLMIVICSEVNRR